MNVPRLVLAALAASGAAAVAAGTAVALLATDDAPARISDRMQWLTKAAPWLPVKPAPSPCGECGQG